jgi:hypothetical protein
MWSWTPLDRGHRFTSVSRAEVYLMPSDGYLPDQ